jgi:hypothetical protein
MSELDASDDDRPLTTDEAALMAYLVVEDEAVRIKDHFVATEPKERSGKRLLRRISRLERAERALQRWQDSFESWKHAQTEDVANLLVSRALKVLVLADKYAGPAPGETQNLGACLHGWLKERVMQ